MKPSLSDIMPLINALQEAALICNSQTREVLYANTAASELFGHDVFEFDQCSLDQLFFDYPPALLNPSGSQHLNRVVARGADNRSVSVAIYQTRLLLHEHDCLLLQARTLASDSLTPDDAKQIFSKMFYDHPDAVLISRLSDGHITQLNTGFEKITGFSEAEARGKSTIDLGVWPYVDDRKEMVKRLRRDGTLHEYPIRIRHRNGEIRSCLISAELTEINGETCIISIARDITQQIQAEQALRSSEEKLRLALTGSHIGTWDWDILTNAVTWSNNVESILRMEPGSFDGSYAMYLSLLHPEDRPKVEAAIAEVLNNDAPYYIEHRIVAANGDHFWMAGRGNVHRDTTGKPVRMTGTVLDITQQRVTELNLQASRKILRLVLDTIPARVFWKDRDSRYLGGNRLFAKDMGLRDHRDLIGRTDHELTQSDLAEVYAAQDQQIMQSGQPNLNYDIKVPNKAGKETWLQLSKVPLTDSDGQIIGVLGTYNDVTAEKQAQEEQRKSKQKLGLHFKQTPLALIEWDTESRVTDWNPAATRTFGYTKAEAMGRSAIDLIIPESAKPHIDKVWQSLLQNQGGKRSTNANITKDGTEIICEWYNTSLVDDKGEVVGVASAAEDITQRINVERELADHRNHLEDVVKARTGELLRLNKEMEAFSYAVSHDLRSPLRAIDGYSHMLMDDYGEVLDAEGRQNLERIRRNAQQMSRLIDDLLKLSRLTRGELKREPVDLSRITHEINNKLKDEYYDRTVVVEIQDGLTDQADEGLLKVVLMNLLDNAWKYTQKTTGARIRFSAKKHAQETIYCVEDNGAGFSMKYVDKLFGAFQRLHRAEEFAGTGIGLATVARIIHRHQGRVWAEGEEQKGARFYFSLPRVDNE